MFMNSKRFRLVGVAIFGAVMALLAAPGLALAAGYLDPGSGSTIVQGLIAGVAVVCRYLRKIKSFFVRSDGAAG